MFVKEFQKLYYTQNNGGDVIFTFFISSADSDPGISCLLAKTINVAPARRYREYRKKQPNHVIVNVIVM